MSVSANHGNLCFMSAAELAALIRSRHVSAREVMAAHLTQINRVNPTINAIVAKLDDDACLALADDADRRLARGRASRAAARPPHRFQRAGAGPRLSVDRGFTDP